MIQVEAYGQMDQDGKIHLINKEIFTEESRINFRGKKIKLTITEDYEPIKDGLRRYYFGIMRGHLVRAYRSKGINYTMKEADEKVRRMYLTKDVIDTDTGEISTELKSLSKEAGEVSNKQMRTFIENVIRFAAEYLDYGIPYPLEY